MESKPSELLRIAQKVRLLIEPVWNRNGFKRVSERCDGTLLIEPVWNRNVLVLGHHTLEFILLLIEPVWNRN